MRGVKSEAAKPEEKSEKVEKKESQKKIDLPEIPYPHCVYNDAGESKVVKSRKEHEELGAEWKPKAIREGREIKMPKAPAEASE